MDRSRPPLRFGLFIAPHHPAKENPTLALQRDVELVQYIEDLGFDEVWIGEHHSAGWEYIASPEVFIAYAAAKTNRIKLGTGMVSLPYHHPFMAAERMILLDHLTRGRVIFGVGPGSLPTDAEMIGLEPRVLRPMLEEAVEAIVALLTSEEPVTMKTDWFTLEDAVLQLRPYSYPELRDGRRRHRVADRSPPRRSARPVARVDRRHDQGRLRRPRDALERPRGGSRLLRGVRRPQPLAIDRPDAPGADEGAGDRGGALRHRGVVPLHGQGFGRSRSSRSSARPWTR